MRTIFIVLILNLAFWFCIGERFLKYVPLERALIKIEQNEYREGYKCEQFSKDLVQELAKSGIQASIIYGEDENTIKDNSIHAWVGIWIEPQTGNFTSNYIQWQIQK